MYTNVGAKYAVTVALLVSLSACSSDSGDPEDTIPNDIDVVDEEPVGGGSNPPTTTVFGPPQFITSECGTLDASTTASTNSVDTPAELFVGELAKGQLIPNSTTDNFHVWQITLAPGNYHLVADASDLAIGTSAIGIGIESLGVSTSDNVNLVSDAVADFDIRLYEYLEIQSAQTLTLKVESLYDTIHDYTFGIFSNGSAVPSPTFERCLPITTVSLDSTQSVVLAGAATRANDNWYLVDLAAGGYQLDASTNSTVSDAIGYSLRVLDQFGQHDRFETVSSDAVAGTLLTTSDTFERDGNSSSWVQMRNLYTNSDDERTVEFTITQQ